MKILYIIIVLLIPVNAFAGERMSKPEAVGKILNITQEIYRIASKKNQVEQADVRKKLESIVKELTSLDQLVLFAIICRGISYPGNAGDELFDQWFEEAFWISIEVIAKEKKGKNSLQELKSQFFFDAGDKLRMHNFILMLEK